MDINSYLCNDAESDGSGLVYGYAPGVSLPVGRVRLRQSVSGHIGTTAYTIYEIITSLSFYKFIMTDFKDLVRLRRSHRKFTGDELDADDLRQIMRAALMSPTSKGQRNWQFIVVDDRSDMEKMADAKEAGSRFLKDATVAIVVLGDPQQNDCWVEDGSIAAVSMQYQAEELGLGSCWIQMRGRGLSDGTSADDIIRGILDIPENLSVLCILAIGGKADERRPQDEERLKWENVHINKY